MKVLLVGSGAREHALAWRISQSPRLSKLWVANGNTGTAQLAENLPVNPEDVAGLVEAACSRSADLAVVGPEAPLSLGLADQLMAAGIPVFGPTQAAARLETSKSFARRVMQAAGVPSPGFWVFQEAAAALDFIKQYKAPLVVKADGLAAGKGVLICPTPGEAASAVRMCLEERAFGHAGATVVLEEMLTGREISVFALTDGVTVASLAAACDYKRAGDGDTGPNTGGMGSFSPPDIWSPQLAEEVCRSIIEPTLCEMARRGATYRGVLYAGLMLTEAGPKVLEFNCRFGDPETQTLMPRLVSDPLEAMWACAAGGLDGVNVQWSQEAVVGVTLASGGYPGKYATGLPISGLEKDEPETLVFHAGTRFEERNRQRQVVTSGGRVLTVVGRGPSLAVARRRAYQRAQSIRFEGAFCRSDIAAGLD